MKALFQGERYLEVLKLLHTQQSSRMSTLEDLNFDNLALRRLPLDSEARNYVRTVNAACFSKVMPTHVNNPKLVAYSRSALSLLELTESEADRDEFVEYFSGNRILPGSETAAHCYCGHQFGYFSGQLGDGAAIYLGEVTNSRNERWEIQLKGAGLTPYSRMADGRKVLRSSIREFLCSEAMHFLRIPTSRAGSCITSDSEVTRDIFYDGHPAAEKCTIVLRIAPTFIRFGSFEIFKTLDTVTGRVGPSVGRTEILHALLDYVIEIFYPEIHHQYKENVEKYAAFFREVVLRTARLVARWQCVGFCHGVLNTDNMSIIGLTLDYGPYGFIDMYDPHHVCNASDDGGRYSFSKQPEICLWNLKKLAEAIKQALPLNVSMPLLELYDEEFQTCYLKKMRLKLGLIASENTKDSILIKELLDTMNDSGADFTNTFLCLSLLDASDSSTLQNSMTRTVEHILENCVSLEVLIAKYKPDLNDAELETYKAIANSHPQLIERLGRSGVAIKRVLSQLEKAETLKRMTADSKNENDRALWSRWLEKYKLRLEKDMRAYVGSKGWYNGERLSAMKMNNPRFILRNYLLQHAIEKAENGDYSEVQKLLELSENPYNQSYAGKLKDFEESAIAEKKDSAASASSGSTSCQDVYDKPPSWATSIRVT